MAVVIFWYDNLALLWRNRRNTSSNISAQRMCVAGGHIVSCGVITVSYASLVYLA